MRPLRIHIRKNWGPLWIGFRIKPMYDGWNHGFNVDLGWIFIAVRRTKSKRKAPFIDF